MPPRRSTRTLPTPADSTKAESIASTPGISPTSKGISGGLVTPSSLTDGDDDLENSIQIDDPVLVKAEDAARAGGRKRKGVVDTASPFTHSPAPSARSRSSTTKYTLESVTVPSYRSQLATETPTSADKLNLGSPISKNHMPSSDPLDSLDVSSTSVSGPTRPRASSGKATRPPSAPVVKEEEEGIAAVDTDSEDKAFARLPRIAKGKGKGKSNTLAPTPSESDVENDEAEVDSYALDSEEEDRQLKKAIQVSVGDIGDSTASSSRASSVPAARGRGKGRGSGRKQAVNGRANNKRVLRAAVTRAAEKHGQNQPMSVESSVEPSTKEVTPATDGSRFEENYESDGSVLSELSEESDDFDFSDSDASVVSPGKRTTKATPKKKAKTKGKGKRKGKIQIKTEHEWGIGQRVDGKEISETPDTDNVDVKPAIDREDMIEKMRKHEANMSVIKKKERQLKQSVGRKLTQGEKNSIRLEHHHEELHDVWGDLAANITPITPVSMEAHPSLKLTLLPFQKESLYWMKRQEEGIWKGGMLADEMGMGKTIQTIALLLSEPRRKPSLVVAPVVALMQWKHEIETHAEGFAVCLWHGSGRMKAAQLKKYDVVLVSYGTLEASFRRQRTGFKRGNVLIKEKSPMHEFEWHRVILDEAHNIKERSTNAAKAAFALSAQYRWCLSGTPLQNRVGELYSLVRFLGADPFSHYFCKKCDCKSLHWQFADRRTCDQCHHSPMDHVCFWNTEILTPIARYGIEQGNPGHTAFKKLKILLDRMMLRRTKLERADDLDLPPRVIVVRRDYFSPAEKELYMSLFTGAKRTFATYVDQGTVLNNYSNIFSLITRMRQMACHPDLVLRSKNSAVAKGITEGSVCRICNDQAEDAIMSQCKHVFDRECIRQYLEVQQIRGHKPECPVCHIEISIDLEAEAIDLEDGGSRKARQGILSRLNLDNWRSSTKLEALVEELEKLRNKDCTIKSLVFSQFVSFLDLIAFRLQRAGFTICRLEGGMTPQQRDATIQHFMNNTNVTVFLISLKAGGVALNLTEASMVFMMDSWWNPSVEYQAMDRIHRLGQKRPVKVVKLVVEDSIEHQIVELQHKKLAMTEAALSTDPDAALGKLTIDDLGFLFKM